MSFDLLRVGNLRNLTDCEIHPDSKINIIFGANASGKSSLLEAIYILGRGRSFRDTQLSNLIRRNQNQFTIFGRKIASEQKQMIGIRYSRAGMEARLDGDRIKKLSDLAEQTSIQAITPNTLQLIEQGSNGRRSLLDWGLFHVEPLFRGLSIRYNRVLAQRNAELKNKSREIGVWQPELVSVGTRITALRESYFEELQSRFYQNCELLNVDTPPAVRFSCGWNSNQSLEQALEKHLQSDFKRGHTTVGPHRADLHFNDEDGEFKKWGSRGQMKMVVIALMLAQKNILEEKRCKETIFLLDDLAAELDDTNLARIYSLLVQSGQQIFVTATDKARLVSFHDSSWFHVEHGSITKVGV